MMWRRVLVLLPNAKSLLRPHNGFFMKSFSSKKRTEDKRYFTVSYLISSCGLTLETAIRASEKVNFRSAERPDSVLSLLRNHGFTHIHIPKLIRSRPDLLLADPQRTLLPKLEFFRSMGFSTADLAKILSSNPSLLRYSLNNHLIPFYNYLKSEILLDDKKIRKTLKYSSRILGMNLENSIVPRISVLREIGVPTSSLSLIVTDCQYVLVRNRNLFNETVKEVVQMGINPLKRKFVLFLKMMSRFSKSRMEYQMEVFRNYGWSENDFQTAFRKEPLSINQSKKKIMSKMDFFVNDMGWEPTDIARFPKVLQYSLEKRIIPRYLVIKVLIWKGLKEKILSWSSLVSLSDSYFLDNFVTKYEKDVPQLLDVFNGKVSLAELIGYESEETREETIVDINMTC
ncbi:hypothetical protein U1Q18_052442 [Sarracenia purpurea var. burkii]